jgi:hypothetical protein
MRDWIWPMQIQSSRKRLSRELSGITIPGGGHCFDGAWGQPIVEKTFAEMMSFLREHVLGG